ncbi:hypothetical protein [Nocardia sp. NPDC056100]|uniref:hypothetical protein n=1 Tax=Nocardia sp. NPDC056100 TaxID=3345712 RepID=UPI0035DE40E8
MELGDNVRATNDPAYEPYGQVQAYPVRMPGAARAAQILSWSFGALGIVLSVIAGIYGTAELCGVLIAGFLPAFFLALFAFGYTVNGNGLRIAAIVGASLQMLWGVSGTMQKVPPGFLDTLVGLTIVILLCRNSSESWFKRPH